MRKIKRGVFLGAIAFTVSQATFFVVQSRFNSENLIYSVAIAAYFFVNEVRQ